MMKPFDGKFLDLLNLQSKGLKTKLLVCGVNADGIYSLKDWVISKHSSPSQ